MPEPDRNLRICFVNGMVAKLTARELLQAFADRRMVAALLAAALTIVWTEPFPAVAGLPPSAELVHWGVVLFGAFGTFLAVTIALGRRFRTAYTVFGHLASATFSAVAGPMMASALGLPPAAPSDVAIIFGFALVVSLSCELVTAVFLLPRVLAENAAAAPVEDMTGFADTRPPPPPSPQAAPDHVVLLGTRFALADLVVVSSDEHYVHVVTTSGRRMLRGRISDIEAQLPADWGLRVHRSHWVAARAVRALQRGRDAWTLMLADGSAVPVARARREAVREWVSRLGLG